MQCNVRASNKLTCAGLVCIVDHTYFIPHVEEVGISEGKRLMLIIRKFFMAFIIILAKKREYRTS